MELVVRVIKESVGRTRNSDIQDKGEKTGKEENWYELKWYTTLKETLGVSDKRKWLEKQEIKTWKGVERTQTK